MPLRSWTFWWTASIKLTLCSHFHIFFFFHPLSFPHLSLILTSELWLGFQSENQTRESREGDDEGAITRDSVRREAHGQTDNRVWRCHSPTQSHALSPFTSSLRAELSVRPHIHTVVCCSEEVWRATTSELTKNCQKSPSLVKPCNICAAGTWNKRVFLILLFVFPQNTSYFKFTVRTYAQTHTLTLLDKHVHCTASLLFSWTWRHLAKR